MTRPPLLLLHKYLDEALLAHPERGQLREFRAPEELAHAEERALASASTCLTPHAHLARALEERGLPVRRLKWHTGEASPVARPQAAPRAVAFPGPTAARKGAHDLREVARELGIEVVLLGSDLEGAGFWDGVRVRRGPVGSDWASEVACVVQPALLEEQPRALLRALARGVPVIATPQCGLDKEDADGLLRLVEYGDAVGLRAAIEALLESTTASAST